MKITKQELIDIIRESINDIDPEDDLREALIGELYEILKERGFTNNILNKSKKEILKNYKPGEGYVIAIGNLDDVLENVLGVTDRLGNPKYKSKEDALKKMLIDIKLKDITIMGGPELAKKLNKITESELKKIIKEETEQVLSEFEE